MTNAVRVHATHQDPDAVLREFLLSPIFGARRFTIASLAASHPEAFGEQYPIDID